MGLTPLDYERRRDESRRWRLPPGTFIVALLAFYAAVYVAVGLDLKPEEILSRMLSPSTR